MRGKRRARSEPEGDGPQDALAVTSRGSLLVNAMCFDGVSTPEEALALASRLGASCFIGVVLSTTEARRALREVESRARESAASLLGARQRSGTTARLRSR